ncbi:MAG TPA: peptidylprolyl isomerase [Elusimicrobia bacterium]|nr:peptidylprolyl isomerase [Elusimicrobiota bacterium]
MKRLPLAFAAAVLLAGPSFAAGPTAAKTKDKSAAASLLEPEKANLAAPPVFKVKFTTTKGEFTLKVTTDWSPNGARRFYNLVKIGYYDNVAFFRNIQGFMVQFGIHGDPAVNAKWRNARILDDPMGVQSNKKGFVTYAMAGPNTRTCQLFINFGDNSTSLDNQGFTPFGKVVSGMEVVEKLYNGYGEGAPRGMGPEQNRIQDEGNAYLKKDFPKLDYIKTARIVK